MFRKQLPKLVTKFFCKPIKSAPPDHVRAVIEHTDWYQKNIHDYKIKWPDGKIQYQGKLYDNDTDLEAGKPTTEIEKAYFHTADGIIEGGSEKELKKKELMDEYPDWFYKLQNDFLEKEKELKDSADEVHRTRLRK